MEFVAVVAVAVADDLSGVAMVAVLLLQSSCFEMLDSVVGQKRLLHHYY